MWNPIFALIIVAFRFPAVKRDNRRSNESEPSKVRSDLERIKEACKLLDDSPAAMLLFAEGTRFTKEKQERLKSPYKHLLPPRLGGFSVLVQSLGEMQPTIVDFTLFYPANSNLWLFLGGAVPNIQVSVQSFEWDDAIATDPATWLEDRWQEKDVALEKYSKDIST